MLWFSNRPTKCKQHRDRPLQLEAMERREMLSVSWGWSGSTLQIIGDKSGVVANDEINVDISSGRVTFSGTGLPSQSVAISALRSGQIDIAGRGGNDTITVTQREPFDRLIRVFGEAGDDQVTLDVQSDSVGRYSVDGGQNGRDVLVIPNRMPGGPNGFPQSVTRLGIEEEDIRPMAQYQAKLRDYGSYPQMQSIWNGQVRTPPFQVGLAERSADRYRLAITQFEVTHPRYQWDSAGTKCNVFAGDVLRAMGVQLPTKDEWNRSGYPGNYGSGDVTITTPALSSWLTAANGGMVRGWRRIDVYSQADLDYLLNLVRQGCPAVAFTPPPSPGVSGHIAILRPDQDIGRLTRDQIPNLITAQAGGKIVGGQQVTNNFSRGRIADGWASSQHGAIQLFVNLGHVSLESFNYPGHRIRHRNSETFIDPANSSTLFGLDSSFRPVQGLADSAAVSFESVNYPGYFLRHQNYRWVLGRNDGSELFRRDATFYTRPGLASTAGVSFESVNYPGHFLRHRNYQLWLDRNDGSNLFKQDATFTPVW